MSEKYIITPENVAKTRDWLKNRGGIAHWKSINLSNPSGSWSTPATFKVADCCSTVHDFVPRKCPHCFERIELANKITSPAGDYLCPKCGKDISAGELVIDYTKPNWECANEPSHITTSEDDVIVEVPVEYKRFKISYRRSSNGLSMKLTDTSTSKVRRWVEIAHEKTGKDSWYKFDYATQQCVILVSGQQTPLKDYQP